jgi:hypothetical protein
MEVPERIWDGVEAGSPDVDANAEFEKEALASAMEAATVMACPTRAGETLFSFPAATTTGTPEVKK